MPYSLKKIQEVAGALGRIAGDTPSEIQALEDAKKILDALVNAPALAELTMEHLSAASAEVLISSRKRSQEVIWRRIIEIDKRVMLVFSQNLSSHALRQAYMDFTSSVMEAAAKKSASKENAWSVRLAASCEQLEGFDAAERSIAPVRRALNGSMATMETPALAEFARGIAAYSTREKFVEHIQQMAGLLVGMPPNLKVGLAA